MQPLTQGADTKAPTRTSKQARRALVAGTLGHSIEFYDFAAYGLAAALVFSHVFFPSLDGTTGTLLSLSTFGVAFVARPLGSIVLGHYGDLLGRKKVLIFTLALMGVSTFGIGLIPSFESIGIWAPVILVLLRMLQGFSIGAEYSGSVVLALEHVSPRHRGLFGALITSGIGWGTLAANGIFLALSFLPEGQFMSWGWRVPFLVSALLFIVTLFLRSKVEESPDFKAAATERDRATNVEKVPFFELIRYHWRTVALVVLMIPGSGIVYYIGTVFSLSYATGELGMDRSQVLTAVLSVNVIIILLLPALGWLADRTGHRRRYLLAGYAGMAICVWIWFAMLNTGNVVFMALGFVVLFVPFSLTYMAQPAAFAHAFPSSVRFSGMATSFNIGTLLGSAFSPVIAAAIITSGGSWVWIALYLTATCAISFVAAYFLREQFVGEKEVVDESQADLPDQA